MEFEENIASIVDELGLAIQWNRPSIIVAVYQSEHVHWNATAEIKQRLEELGQEVYYLKVDKNNFDVPLILSQIPEKEHKIFFVSGLKWGGGQWGRNAYRSLNLRREFFVEHHLRTLFWLTDQEAEDLPRRAPDFWAFRHRVFEFVEFSPRLTGDRTFISKPVWDAFPDVSPQELDEMIGMREKMLASLPDTYEAQPTRLDLLYHLAALYRTRGDAEKSLKLLSSGLELSNRMADIQSQSKFWLGLGVVHFEADKLDDAQTAFLEAIELNPKNINAWLDLSLIYLVQAQPDDAIKACQQALEIDPQNGTTWYNLGNLYHDLGNFQEALAAYKKGVKIDPGNSALWFQLGRMYRYQERDKDAIHAFNKARKIDPGQIDAWINLGCIYRDKGQYADAIRILEKAREHDPASADVTNQLGHIYLLLGQLSDAVDAYKASLQIEPPNAEAQLSLGIAYLKSEKEEASAYIGQAGQLIADQKAYLQACYYAVIGDADKAVELISQAVAQQRFILPWVRIDPRFDTIRDNAGFINLLSEYSE
jgi:tetratricopeptide (TPR) repeat protein